MAILHASPPPPPFIRKKSDPIYGRPFCWFCAIERRTWIKTGAECIIRTGTRKRHHWFYPKKKHLFHTRGKYIMRNKEVWEVTDLLRWGRWMENVSRQVRISTIDDYVISTVFLGIDHRFINDGQPVVFETMVFRNDGASSNDMRRYTTYADAVAGHKEVVQAIKDGKL